MQIELRPKLSFDVYAGGQLLGNFTRQSEWEGLTLLFRDGETIIVQRPATTPFERILNSAAGNESETAIVNRATEKILHAMTAAIDAANKPQHTPPTPPAPIECSKVMRPNESRSVPAGAAADSHKTEPA